MLKDAKESESDVAVTLRRMSEVLGLGLENLEEEKVVVPSSVQKLLDDRMTARKDKNFTESDRLRDEIRKLGYIVKDSPDGQEVVKI